MISLGHFEAQDTGVVLDEIRKMGAGGKKRKHGM